MDLQKDVERWGLLQKKVQRTNVALAFEVYREHGIEPILIKGFAAGLNYPDSEFRPCSDVDLAVERGQLHLAEKVYSSELRNRVSVDLHEGLRHHDTVKWDDLFANSVIIDVDGVAVRILRPEDHLRVMIVHWLTDGGAYKQRLWDIYYAVSNRPADFDWDRCLNVVSPTRRRWIICTIGLAHKYLALYIDDLEFADEAKDLPDWLIRALQREWASDVRLTPIHSFLHDRAGMIKQIRKRIPPNPIQAVIEMEGSFDSKTRVFYQAGSVFKRLGPSVKRVMTTIFRTKR